MTIHIEGVSSGKAKSRCEITQDCLETPEVCRWPSNEPRTAESSCGTLFEAFGQQKLPNGAVDRCWFPSQSQRLFHCPTANPLWDEQSHQTSFVVEVCKSGTYNSQLLTRERSANGQRMSIKNCLFAKCDQIMKAGDCTRRHIRWLRHPSKTFPRRKCFNRLKGRVRCKDSREIGMGTVLAQSAGRWRDRPRQGVETPT